MKWFVRRCVTANPQSTPSGRRKSKQLQDIALLSTTDEVGVLSSGVKEVKEGRDTVVLKVVDGTVEWLL